MRIQVSDQSAEKTNPYPLIYDFFQCDRLGEGTRLIVSGVSAKFLKAMAESLTHFYNTGNALLAEPIVETSDFSVYRSTTPSGHVFYRGLKRGLLLLNFRKLSA